MRRVFFYVLCLAGLLHPGMSAAAEERASFNGFSFALGIGTADTGRYATGTLAYMFPVGSGSVMVGPVLGTSGFKERTTQPAPKTQPFVLDRRLGQTDITLNHQLSLGVRVGSVVGGRSFLFGEVGVEYYDISIAQTVFSMNRQFIDQSSDRDIAGYAALGAELCATSGCMVTYTGQVRYHEATTDVSVRLGLGIRF